MKAGDAEGEVGQASSGLSRQPRLHCVLHCAQLSLSCPQAPWAAVGVGKGVLLPGSGSRARWVPGTAYPEHQQGGECGCAGWHSLGTVTPQQFCFASPALGNHQGTGLGAIAKVDRRIASPTAGPRKREGNQANQDLCALLGVAQGSWCAVDITVGLGAPQRGSTEAALACCPVGPWGQPVSHRGAPQRLPVPVGHCPALAAGLPGLSSVPLGGLAWLRRARPGCRCCVGSGGGWRGGIRISCPPSLPGISRGQRGAGSRQLPWGRKPGYFGGCGGGAVGWHCPCQVTPPAAAPPWCQDGAPGAQPVPLVMMMMLGRRGAVRT